MKKLRNVLVRGKCIITLVVLLCALTVFGNEKGNVHAEETVYLHLHSNYETDKVVTFELDESKLNSRVFGPNFSRKGYRVDGYTYDKEGLYWIKQGPGNSGDVYMLYANDGSVALLQMPTENFHMYASWELLTYNITYNCNGGSNSEINPAIYTVESDITLEEPIRDGYDFTGWYTDEELSSEKITNIPIGSTENITLYAGWKCNHTSASPMLKNYKEATCCEDGYSGDEYCVVCEEEIGTGVVISATGKHDTTVTGAKEATCQEEGNTGNTYCVTSGRLLSTGEVIPKKSHDKDVLKNQKDATCYEDGYTGDKYCSICDTLQDTGQVIPVTGHKWNNGLITKEPTEEDTGIRTFTCTVCGEVNEEILPIVVKCEHAKTSVKNQKDASCEEKGYTGDIYCTDCKALVSTGIETDKLEHKWDGGVITKKPTATEEGIKTYTCAECGTTKEMLILATGGSPAAEQVTTEQITTEKIDTSTVQSTETVTKEKSVTVKKISSLKLKNKKNRTVTVTFKKVKGAKYQVQYSTKKNFKNAKKKNLTKTSYTIKKLKKGKTYYVRVRAYKKVSSKTYYSKWTTKKIKIKK